MKHLKFLGLVALAAMAVMAFAAASASATGLYKNHSTSERLGVGAEIKSSLTGSAKLTTTGGTLLDTCTGGEVNGKITNAGGTGPVEGSIEALTWTGCTEPTETSTKGSLSIASIAGTTNGTLTGKNSVVKVNTTIFEAICEYTVGKELDLGTLEGAKTSTGSATLAINTVVPSNNSFFCPDAKWEANYTVTSPAGLIVEGS